MSQFYSLKVNQIKKETHDSVSVSFEIESKLANDFKFIPGQYITIKININGEDCRRSYSICSSSNEKLTVAIKKVPNGKMSNFINNKLKTGDFIDVSTPEGNFKLENIDSSNNRKFVAFAAGSGITPILSMIKEIILKERNTQFLLFYSNKTSNDTMFKSEINSLLNDNFSVKYIYTREETDLELYNGRIDENKTTQLLKSEMSFLNADGFYLCGPEEMIFSAKRVLESFDVSNEKINFELFTTPVLEKEESTSMVNENDFSGSSNVTVICDDEEVEFSLDSSGESILDAAMEQDLDVPFSCKGAVCCTCKAKVKTGKVTMDANYALSEQEVDEGYILACQAHPASADVTVDFDY